MVFLAALCDLQREGWSRGLLRLSGSSPPMLAENEGSCRRQKSTKHCASTGVFLVRHGDRNRGGRGAEKLWLMKNVSMP